MLYPHPPLISLASAAAALHLHPSPFLELFRHGSLQVELYQPHLVDHQQPHTRDEVYLIAAGSGSFYYEGQRYPFHAGDFLFVPAGAEHRFESFSPDFLTWVLFYGPEGGETP